MKQSPELKKAQEKMKPGAITRDGFLGNDSRNLIDILIEDDADVARLKLTHRHIAAKMRKMKEAGKKGLGDFIDAPPHFEILVDSARGKLPCPFPHPGLIRKTYIVVRNKNLNREIVFTDMNIHLIEAHGFYEGKGAPFRLKPKDLKEILEIEPEGS